MPSEPLADVLAAPAKLTTRLRVTGVRDDGYHLLDAEMVVAGPRRRRRGGRPKVGPNRPSRSSTPGGRPLDVGRRGGQPGLPRPRLDRSVGPAPGDQVIRRSRPGRRVVHAAAVLRWAGWSDLEAAAELGADVPFCLTGGRARVRGIGELVEPLPFEARTFTLLTPPFGCSTVEVYRAWDRLGGPTGKGTNDLEPAALVVEPRLAEWRDRLADATGQAPRLAGSGSTWCRRGRLPR